MAVPPSGNRHGVGYVCSTSALRDFDKKIYPQRRCLGADEGSLYSRVCKKTPGTLRFQLAIRAVANMSLVKEKLSRFDARHRTVGGDFTDFSMGGCYHVMDATNRIVLRRFRTQLFSTTEQRVHVEIVRLGTQPMTGRLAEGL